MLLYVLLLSPKQPIAPVISSSVAPAANLPPLQSKAGIMVQANYAAFDLERAGKRATKLSFQFSYCGAALCALVCMHQQTQRDHLA